MAAPSRKELERYFELDQQRLALHRQAKDLEKLQEELEKKFLEYVREVGGPERACLRCGYKLAILRKDGSVSWVKEFLRVAGEEEAERLRKAAPPRDVLVVEPPLASSG